MASSQIGFDYLEGDPLTGYRLERLEVLNWGTFNKHIWTLVLDGRNGLLTGEIGTGKSTLVDAVTTLLVPAHRVAYNKAAGAATRERSLRSYVLGHYKAERGEFADSSARPVALRDNKSFSVVLGVFKNVGYSQVVTLAQVFWIADGAGQPRRLFAAAEREMSIAGDFSRFGTEIAQLRKRLRRNDVSVWDSFPPYGAWFRRRFGIHNEQALELFHQTVSMKSVGNLTDFVRNHMLEPFDAVPRIEALISHFDDLDRAHEAVLKAKHQIELLVPLVEDCDRYAALSESIDDLNQTRAALSPYFASLKLELVDERIKSIRDDLARQTAAIRRCDERRDTLAAKIDDLKRDITESGGDRLNRLDAAIRNLAVERDRRARKSDEYSVLLRKIDEKMPDSADGFESQCRRLADLAEEARGARDRVQNDLMERKVSFRQEKDKHDVLAAEIASLKARTTNIPTTQIAMRRKICEAVHLEESSVPFVGELVGVKEEALAWEGAAERLLRSFGLSLLVADRYYPVVAAWVDKTNLRGRLVYFRAREQRGQAPELHRNSLVKKLTVKPDSSFYGWLNRELSRRFDMACCATHEQFRQEPRAITQSGQIKAPGERHEKDDRYRIDDRARYILGWENAAKIDTLEARARLIEARLTDLGGQIASMESDLRSVNVRVDTLSRIESYSSFREIDWQTTASQIAELTKELNQLRSASDKLMQLKNELDRTKNLLNSAEKDRNQKTKALGGIEEKLKRHEVLQTEALAILEESDIESVKSRFESLSTILSEILGDRILRVESCDKNERMIDVGLKKNIDSESKTQRSIQYKVTASMIGFSNTYPLETSEFDPSMESHSEYRDLLGRLQSDDLPSFEARFKKLLNENTIREVANFQSILDRERETIKGRIEHINDSLAEIDYNPGRFIKLQDRYAPDQEIRDFRKSLKECTEGALSGSDDDQYSEGKFLRVKAVIERLRGREGSAELDRRWVWKVTDVRNWFVFGASERWRESDVEYEHYSDSGGKSGGQKEKLAYTVLAASLSYQFGLEPGSVRSRSFRFVVIDEAFGRGSDESTQYALTLFSKLHLQLLIVTPLQKIHVIEPYVESVGFVQIDDDRDSRLRNLSVREYNEEKQAAGGVA